MAIGELLQSVTAFVASCTKHVSRATKKLRDHPTLTSKLAWRKRGTLLPRGPGLIPFLTHRKRIAGDGKKHKATIFEEEKEEVGLWRRTILMGEKCQPLDFSGVIYYDSNGKRLSEAPTPRSPLRSPLPSSSFAYLPAVVRQPEFGN